MKLHEIKHNLIGQFFSKQSAGIDQRDIDPVYEQLSVLTGLSSKVSLLESEEGVSSDPSKAFKRFTEGRKATLTICEEDGLKKMAIFAAVRYGKVVAIEDLTLEDHTPKIGDLSDIKNALRHAKNLNDDVFFSIKNEG